MTVEELFHNCPDIVNQDPLKGKIIFGSNGAKYKAERVKGHPLVYNLYRYTHQKWVLRCKVYMEWIANMTTDRGISN